LVLGREGKPHAAVRHLTRRAGRRERRNPKVALTTTGSWWPRLRRRRGACLKITCDKERATRASVEFENWERELDRLPAREEGPVDEPWVEEVDEDPGEREPSRRLMEQGTPSTLESSLASSVSASSGEIGESTIGDVCWISAFT
jgi:hypothetical protein|tara:strand:- start:93 stop:527 length:435 start_codon:yes stop_codon:yes gene_type:complete